MTGHAFTGEFVRPTLSPPRVLRIGARTERCSLLLYRHGYRSRAEVLYPVAAALAATFPDAESILPDGFASTTNGAGRKWWIVEGMTDKSRAQRIRTASVDFERWLNGELAARSLDNQGAALLGFSQGAALAATVGSRRSVQTVVSLLDRRPELTHSAASTPFLLIHGTRDEFVSASDATRFQSEHRARGAEVELRLLPELGHGIDHAVVEIARKFVASTALAEVRSRCPPRSTWQRRSPGGHQGRRCAHAPLSVALW